MSKSLSKTLQEPVITEKSTALSRNNKYTFYVAKDATKTQIKKVFQDVFPGRKVLSVETLPQRGHKRRTKSGYKSPRDKKKAVISIEGDKIEYFPELS